MTIRNFLNLQEKQDNIVIIEKKILIPRSFRYESLRTLFVIFVVLALTWGVSKAMENEIEQATKNFSVIGVVSELSDSSIMITSAQGSNQSNDTVYRLNIEYLEKIETSEYEPRAITDVYIGNTIIAQGLTDNSKFFIKRIVLVPATPLPLLQEPIIEKLATTTEDIATTTPETSGEPVTDTTEQLPTIETEVSTTSTSTENVNSSDSIIDTITDVVDDVIIGAIDIIENIVDLVTGTSTPDNIEESTPEPIPQIEEFIPEPTQELAPTETESPPSREEPPTE